MDGFSMMPSFPPLPQQQAAGIAEEEFEHKSTSDDLVEAEEQDSQKLNSFNFR
jgi:hypothetical protein